MSHFKPTIHISDLIGGTAQIGAQTRLITATDGRVSMGTLTIRTPIPFVLDPCRYHIVAARTPVQTAQGITPAIEMTMDYALLAADLEACGWPEDLVSAVRMCAEDYDPFGDEDAQDPDSRPL